MTELQQATAQGARQAARGVGWLFRNQAVSMLAILAILWIVLGFLSPFFFTVDNLFEITLQTAVIAVIASGMTFVIISGGIDLSVGSVFAASAVVGGMAYSASGSLALALLATGATGALFGAANGLLVTALGVPAFIGTLGMMGIARGVALILVNGVPIYGLEGYRFLGQGKVLEVIPVPTVIIVALYALGFIVLEYTRFGRFTYATGSNAEAARLSGIGVKRVQVGIYTICGLLAGLASTIEAGRLGMVQPSGGNGYELFAIGAVIIGGASTFGGEGSIVATLIWGGHRDHPAQRAQHPGRQCVLAVRRERAGHHRGRGGRSAPQATLTGRSKGGSSREAPQQQFTRREGAHMTKLRLGCIAVIATAALGFAPGARAAESKTIVFIPKSTSATFYLFLVKGAQDKAKELGYDIDYVGPATEADVAAQVDFVRTIAKRKPAGILLAALDAKALIPPIEEAMKAGVPVVMVDSGVDGDAPVASILTDQVKGGEMAGQAMAKLLGEKGLVADHGIQPGSVSAGRSKGFQEIIAKYPGMKALPTKWTDCESTKSMNFSTDELTANPDLAGIFNACAASAGDAQAVKAKGLKGKVKIVAFDPSPEVLPLFDDGTISALVAQDPYQMGYQGVAAIDAFKKGKPIPQKNVLLPPVLITPENVKTPEVQKLLQTPDKFKK